VVRIDNLHVILAYTLVAAVDYKPVVPPNLVDTLVAVLRFEPQWELWEAEQADLLHEKYEHLFAPVHSVVVLGPWLNNILRRR